MQSRDQFIEIIQENEGIIYKIVRAYVSDIDHQKDLYQDIVYQLWKSFGSFRGEAKVSTWIYRIALNTSITHLNKGKRRPATVELSFEHDHILNTTESEELEEKMKVLYSYIKALDLIDKGIILLYLEGNTYEEIGHIIGFTTSRIGTRISRIKDKLKKQINT